MAYIQNWSLNAKQHFEDGDYKWICDLIPNYRTVFEIGCGAGYSTLTFILRGFEVITADLNSDAIKATKVLISENDRNPEEIAFHELNVVHEINRAKEIAKGADIIVLCNPGGNLSNEITSYERRLLEIGGFSNEEMQSSPIDFLHKWSQIFGACATAFKAEKPILIIERVDNIDEGKQLVNQIASDMEMRLINVFFRPIRKPPEGGVYLKCGDSPMWVAAIYFPT